jgi:predicted acylesterase/phospholipase RssA
MKTIENLVFGGGGMLGAAYVGAFQVLEENHIAGNSRVDETPPADPQVWGAVTAAAGTSAGAIFAALVALGNSATAIAKIMASTDLATFADFAPGGMGLCKGEVFRSWMQDRVFAALGKRDATFADLRAKAQDPKSKGLYKDLHVFSHSVESSRTVEFSAASSPDVPIADAVRASMSVPFFFRPWNFTGTSATAFPGDYIDGGVAFNYPVSAFDSASANDKTLGFILENMNYESEGIVTVALHVGLYGILRATGTLGTPLGNVLGLCLDTAIGFYKSYYRLEDKPLPIPFMAADPGVATVLRTTDDGTPARAEAAAAELTVRLTALRDRVAGADASRAESLDLAAVQRDMLSIVALVSMAAESGTAGQALASKAIASLADRDGVSLEGVWSDVLRFGSILGATFNLPTNLVFQRDAGRTVMLNCLGYQFADFWLPKCDTDRLIDAGRTCARDYLSFIMYA